jgi:hypothetical protein
VDAQHLATWEILSGSIDLYDRAAARATSAIDRDWAIVPAAIVRADLATVIDRIDPTGSTAIDPGAPADPIVPADQTVPDVPATVGGTVAASTTAPVGRTDPVRIRSSTAGRDLADPAT